MLEIQQLAKYPFRQAAKRYMQKEAPTINEILTDPLYDRARSIAIERIERSYDKKDVGDRPLITETDCIMELFSYPLARMIAVTINDTFFTRRYALGEAVHIYKNLIKEDSLFISEIAKEFDMDIQSEENTLFIFFTHYLHYAPTRYKSWKMINREMEHGYITLSSRELARLIQEAFRLRINKELAEKTPDERISTIFKSEILKIKQKIALEKEKIDETSIHQLDVEKLPPCLKMLLSSIQSGENVPHMGRFSLVAFLNTLHLSVEDIMNIFSTAPDFEEERTRYQIENITGTTSATSYKSPGCQKMKTYGICPSDKMDDLCRTIHHPLSYYKKKWKQDRKKKT